MLPEYFEFSMPTKVVYGIGILANIGDAVKPLGNRKAMVVTDEILVHGDRDIDGVVGGALGERGESVRTFPSRHGLAPLVHAAADACFPAQELRRDPAGYADMVNGYAVLRLPGEHGLDALSRGHGGDH